MPRANGVATRQRIITEATRLFAAQGIRATTVAQIEGAAGLRPGSGGLHRHFPTKNDLIQAVLDAQLDDAEQDLRDAQSMPRPRPEELNAFLDAVGHALLDGADRHREVALIMLREAHTLPDEMLDAHTRRNFALTYETVAEQLRGTFGERVPPGVDVDALAFLLVAPLVYYRIIEWAMGSPVLGLDDDRLVSTWTSCFEPLIASVVDEGPPAPARGKNFRA